jgi:hypothetical protein
VHVVRLSALGGVLAALFLGGRPDTGGNSLLVAAAIAVGVLALAIAAIGAYVLVRATLAKSHRTVVAR